MAMAGDDARGTHLARLLGHWPAALALLIWTVAVGWPMLAITPTILAAFGQTDVAQALLGDAPAPKSLGELLITSVGWALLVAICAALVGWLPGRWLGGLLSRRGFIAASALVIVPLCLPAYLVFYAWWQSWPAGTALHRWVIERHAMQLARDATLLAGLVCWSWPLVAVSVAGQAARRPRTRDEMLLIDGAPLWTRFVDRLRTDLPGLLIGMLLVFLATLNNTTCFDLAEVFTFANELRARQALEMPSAQVLAASLPMIAIAVAGALAVWLALGRRAGQAAVQPPLGGKPAGWITALIWMLTVFAPLALFWRGVAQFGGVGHAFSEYANLYAASTLSSLLSAAASGIAAMIATFGLAMLWHNERAAVRTVAHIVSLCWLAWSLLPGTILGLALHHAWSRGVFDDALYRTPMILNIAHLASAGFVCALLARWSARGEARSLHDLRRLDGALSFTGLWRSARPTMLAASIASGVIVTAFAVGETAVTAQVVPPMPIDRIPIAMTLLNDMHYQRPQTVLVACILLTALALAAGLGVAAAWRIVGRSSAPQAAAFLALGASMMMPAGCSGSNEAQPLDVEYIFGSPGQSLGQFGYPRCLDIDQQHHFVYVIDKTARVQRFDFEGHAQIEWHMPEKEQGKPTGVTIGPNGHVYVADTHYFRVIEYDADGNEIRRFGSYGEEPGQFIYLTDVAFGPDGNLYVSEYGGNDRVQVFTPEGQYLREFGSFGKGEGEFNRPQSLAFSPDGSELFITDACNHRIVVTDPQGKWLRTFGSAGREPGQLAYPYGLEMLRDGSILVAEFGNNRIQHFDRNGRSLGVLGRVGRGKGELQYPWAVAAADDRIFVLDSGNNRVQVMDQF